MVTLYGIKYLKIDEKQVYQENHIRMPNRENNNSKIGKPSSIQLKKEGDNK